MCFVYINFILVRISLVRDIDFVTHIFLFLVNLIWIWLFLVCFIEIFNELHLLALQFKRWRLSYGKVSWFGHAYLDLFFYYWHSWLIDTLKYFILDVLVFFGVLSFWRSWIVRWIDNFSITCRPWSLFIFKCIQIKFKSIVLIKPTYQPLL